MGNTKNFMSEAQLELATQVLNRLVPPHDGLPGAGDVGVIDFMDPAGGASLPLRRVLTDVFAAIEAISQADYVASFLDALGIDARPPQPRGYSLSPFDTAILERVRKRD